MFNKFEDSFYRVNYNNNNSVWFYYYFDDNGDVQKGSYNVQDNYVDKNIIDIERRRIEFFNKLSSSQKEKYILFEGDKLIDDIKKNIEN
jgi:hypothetical protein